MKIVIFGADNLIGQLVIEKAVRLGHEVVAFVPNENALKMNHPYVTIQVGSLSNKQHIKDVITGANVVLSTLKPKLSIARKVKELPIATAHQLIMETMEEVGVNRFITLGSTTITAKEDVHQIVTVIPRKIVKRLFPNAYHEMKKINQLLNSSTLDWTVVRAVKTNKAANNGYKLSFGDTLGEISVSKDNVAQCLLDAIGKKVWYRKMPIVFNQK